MWYLNIYLTTDRINTVFSRALYIYLFFFKNKFKRYFNYPIYFNNYNRIYKKRVNLYKLNVLNKISNIKRFIFFKNKKLNGYSIFNYIRSFSFKYHINHLLWHSHYSILLFKYKDYYFNGRINNINLNYLNLYSKINLSNYSFIFNLYLNIFDIKNEWSIELTYNKYNKLNSLYNNTYYYYYYYGNNNYFNLNNIDIYRLFISILFKYYNDFLSKLSRYSYIVNYNNYKIKDFFMRYINIKMWLKHLYIRYHLTLYRFKYWTVWVKRAKLEILKPRKHYAWRVRRIELIPWWFFFEKYIKLFVYFLLNIYYTKLNFIYWWLNNRLNYSINLLLYLKFLEFKYNNKLVNYINNKLVNYINNKLVNYINNNLLIYYKALLFNIRGLNINNINLINLNIILKIYFIIFNIKLSLNFKYLLYYKITFYNIIKYYWSLLFKLRNKYILIKPNYYYFRNHK